MIVRPLAPAIAAGSMLKGQSGYQVSIPDGSSDAVITLNGAEVMRISLGAKMSIKSQNDLTFEAPNITLKADKSVTISTGTGDMSLKSGSALTLSASTNMTIKCGFMMTLTSSSTMDLKGSTVNIN